MTQLVQNMGNCVIKIYLQYLKINQETVCIEKAEHIRIARCLQGRVLTCTISPKWQEGSNLLGLLCIAFISCALSPLFRYTRTQARTCTHAQAHTQSKGSGEEQYPARGAVPFPRMMMWALEVILDHTHQGDMNSSLTFGSPVTH